MAQRQARRIVLYGMTSGIREGLLGLRGVLLAAVLGPSAFGVWTLFRIASRYLGIVELAVRGGLELEASQAAASSDRASEIGLGRVVVGFLGLVYGPVGASLLAVSFWVGDPPTRWVLRVLGLSLLAERLWFYGLAFLRSTGSLGRFAVVEVSGAVLHLVIATAFALKWGLPGAFGGFVLAAALSLALLRPAVPLTPAVSKPLLRGMLRVGTPLGLTAALTLGIQTVDRLVVAAFGGTELLGFYALAGSIAGAAASGVLVVRTVVFPDVYRQAGSVGGAPAADRLIQGTIAPFVRVYGALLGLASFAIGPLILGFLPDYVDAVVPARILIFAGATSGLSGLASVGLVAVSRQKTLPGLAALALGFNLVASAWLLHLGLGLTAIAGVALLSRAGFTGAALTVAAAADSRRVARRQVARAMLPLAYGLALVLGLGVVFPRSDWGSALLSAAAYCVLFSPLLLAIWRGRSARRAP